MSKRQVTLKLTTQKDVIKHESAARTYGELKKELNNVKWSGMRVVERTNKTTLQHTDAVLPATDFVLFLVPEKVKSGNEDKKNGLQNLKNISEASYNDARSHISFLNKVKNAEIAMDGGVNDLRARLNSYYKNSDAKAPASITTAIEMIEEHRKGINEAIDAIIVAASTSPETVEDTTEYLVKTSVDDLENEISELKSILNL
jgi:hypothetical protein